MCRITSACASVLLFCTLSHGQTFLGKDRLDWQRELTGGTPATRRGAAFALGKLGLRDEQTFNALLGRLNDRREDPIVLEGAGLSLGDLLVDSPFPLFLDDELFVEVLSRLAKESTDARVRRSALYALGAAGPTAEPARPVLEAALKDREPMVRRNAAWALGRIKGKPGPATINGLRDLLKERPDLGKVAEADREPLQTAYALVRRDAVQALGELGRAAAKDAAADMIALIDPKKEPDAVVRRAAFEQIVAVAGPEMRKDVGVLEEYLKSDDRRQRRLAAIAIVAIGGDSVGRAEQILCTALLDSDSTEVAQAAAALGRLGAKASADAAIALNSLLERTNKPDEHKRFAEARLNTLVSLARMGKAAAPAISGLMRTLENQEELPVVRRYAAETLSIMGYPANEKAVPLMLKIMVEPTPAEIPVTDVHPTSQRQFVAEQQYEHRLMRLRCTFGMRLLTTEAFRRHKVEDTLKILLEEPDPNLFMLTYDAARVLAQQLRSGTPAKCIPVLLKMLDDERFHLYDGSEVNVRVGSEGGMGKSDVQSKNGSDGRFLAAIALGNMGSAARKPEVIKALKEAEKRDDANMKKWASLALLEINGPDAKKDK